MAAADQAPGSDGGARRFRFVSIDRNHRIRLSEQNTFDDRNNAADLLPRRDTGVGSNGRKRNSGTRGFATDIENVGAFLDQADAVLNGCGAVGKEAAIRERIRRDVEYAHDEGALAQGESPLAEVPCKALTHPEDCTWPER